MTYKEMVIKGVSWVALGRIAQQVIQIIIGFVLVRLLTPEAYGLLGMIVVFIGFATLFSELGFGAAIVQRKEIEERHLSSVFWVNLVGGVIVTVVMILCAPLIAAFYREPLLVPLVTLLAFNFTIGAFNDIQTAILNRSMDFRRLTVVTIGATITSGIVAILMAFMGFGVWSLIIQLLMNTFVEVVLMWVLAPWKPQLIFDWVAIQELLNFSLNLLGNTLINYGVRNLDNLLIGRYTDAFSLGIYRQAYNLMLMPTNLVTKMLTPVMFPALSRIQDDIARVKSIILKAHRLIALLTIPMFVGLFVVAGDFVLVVFGERWLPIVPILRILTVAGVLQPVATTAGWVFKSLGRTDLQFRWSLFSGFVTFVGFFIGIRYGILGVALAYAIRTYLVLYPSVNMPGRLIGLSFREYLSNIAGVVICSLLMGFAVWGIGLLFPPDSAAWIQLIVQIMSGVVVYVALIFGLRLKASREVLDLATSRFKRA